MSSKIHLNQKHSICFRNGQRSDRTIHIGYFGLIVSKNILDIEIRFENWKTVGLLSFIYSVQITKLTSVMSWYFYMTSRNSICAKWTGRSLDKPLEFIFIINRSIVSVWKYWYSLPRLDTIGVKWYHVHLQSVIIDCIADILLLILNYIRTNTVMRYSPSRKQFSTCTHLFLTM